jgi:hypothetical protein
MEVVNKCLETYLRCFDSEKQHQWVQWLPLAEWWYNTSYHIATRMTPFESGIWTEATFSSLILTGYLEGPGS